MKYWYIEYELKYSSQEFEENESTIIYARSKKKAIQQLKENCKKDGYDELTIDTIYQTPSDSRS